MKGVLIVPCLVLLLLLSACSSQKSMVVLLPDRDGKVGSIEVTNDKGSYTADKAGETVAVAADGKPQAGPAMNDEQINKTFGRALAVEPLPPLSFLLYFKTNSFELTNGSRALLDPIIDAIKTRQSENISVVGHTDTEGSKEYNFTLSTKRAKTVHDLLVERGVDPAIIEVTSYGEANLLVPTADNVKEPRNRRVEVIVR